MNEYVIMYNFKERVNKGFGGNKIRANATMRERRVREYKYNTGRLLKAT